MELEQTKEQKKKYLTIAEPYNTNAQVYRKLKSIETSIVTTDKIINVKVTSLPGDLLEYRLKSTEKLLNCGEILSLLYLEY